MQSNPEQANPSRDIPQTDLGCCNAGDGSITLLLADDDYPIRHIISGLLRRKGHNVVEAADGLQALALFSSDPHRFGAAILDIVMPGHTGVEVMREIRRQRPDIPVMFISGYSVEELQDELQGVPGIVVLMKPFTREDFLERLGTLLGR